MKRLIALPREARNTDISALIQRRAELIKDRKNTAIVDRKLRLARAHQIRNELRAS